MYMYVQAVCFTLKTLNTTEADDIFPENRLRHFMQMCIFFVLFFRENKTWHSMCIVFLSTLLNLTMFQYPVIIINPFMPNELFYHKSLDWSISSGRGVWLVFIMTMFYRTSCIKCKQCEP